MKTITDILNESKGKPLYKIGGFVSVPSRFSDSEPGDMDDLKILDIEWDSKEKCYIYKFNNLEVEYWESEDNLKPCKD